MSMGGEFHKPEWIYQVFFALDLQNYTWYPPVHLS